MKTLQQIKLSETPSGRIRLHLMAMFKDKHLRFHLKGIRREISMVAIGIGLWITAILTAMTGGHHGR